MSEREKQTPASLGRMLRFDPDAGGTAAAVNGKAVPISLLAPQREPEPPIAEGVDLSGVPKIVFAAGRGKTGKTTLLRWITEMSVTAGHDLILADIDPSNASFSVYFEGVNRPETDDPAGVEDWLVKLLQYAAREKQSAVIDLGGGDTTLRTIAGKLPGFADTLVNAGIAPVMFYVVGREPEDLTPALTLAARGFSPKAQAIVLNEYVIPTGMTRRSAFARLIASEAYAQLSASSVLVWMPRLFAAEAIEARHCWFTDVRTGKLKQPLELFDSTRVIDWLNRMDQRFAGVRTWLP